MKYVVRLLMAFCAIAPAWGQLSPIHPFPAASSRYSDALQSSSSSAFQSSSSTAMWAALGPGLPGAVSSMTMMNGELYAVHRRSHLTGNHSLSKWNGSYWTLLHSSVGWIDCLAEYRGELYLGGSVEFSDSNTRRYRQVGRWDGARLHPLGGELIDSCDMVDILDIKEFRGELYFSGAFRKKNKETITIVRLEGSELVEVEKGPTGIYGDPSLPAGGAQGSSMEVYKGELYLAGAFKLDGVRTTLAKWDGRTWSAVPDTKFNVIFSLGVYKGELYCSSNDMHKGKAGQVMRWDGREWNGVGNGYPFGWVGPHKLTSYNGKLYGSTIRLAETMELARGIIVTWDGTQWDSITTFATQEYGLSPIGVFGDRLYAWGTFAHTENDPEIALNYVAVFCDDGTCGSISGRVFNDADDDCIPDSTEPAMRRHFVEILPGPMYAITDDEGRYHHSLLPGTYTVSLIPRSYWNLTCPVPPGSYTITVDSNENMENLSFGVQPDGAVREVSISMVSGRARLGEQLVYSITYENTGTVAVDGTIRLFLDSRLTFDSSAPPPARLLPPLAEWDFTGLQVGEERRIKVWTRVPLRGERGWTICSEVIADIVDDPILGIDNRDSVCVEVTGSYDPNDISVSPYGIEDNGEITPHDSVLTYMVRFQNTGNDTAFKVVVADTLSSHLDITSIKLGAASHPFSFSISGENILTWTFNNIMLPDSNASEANSHGMFKYSVHLKPGLSAGTIIPNRASIYFDYNAPVMTNTVRNTITGLLSVPEPANEDDIVFFPNPVRGNLKIAGEIKAGSMVSVQDILGRTVLEQAYTGGEIMLDMVSLPAGTYFVRIPARSGMIVRQVNVVR